MVSNLKLFNVNKQSYIIAELKRYSALMEVVILLHILLLMELKLEKKTKIIIIMKKLVMSIIMTCQIVFISEVSLK